MKFIGHGCKTSYKNETLPKMNEVPKMLWNRWGAGGLEEWFLVIKAHGQSLLFN
jgi:hypothetical protein